MDLVSPLFTVILSGISAYIGWRIAKPRLFNEIAEFMDNYIGEKLESVMKNPELLNPLFDVAIKQGMKASGIEKAARPQRMEFLGMKIPGDIAQMGMRLLMPKLQEMMGGGAEKAAESAFG